MPRYELKCNKCGEQFEVSVSIKDKENGVKCIKCGSPDIRQVYSAHVLLKGTGGSSNCASNCNVCKGCK